MSSSEREKKFLWSFSLLFLVCLFPIARGCTDPPKKKKKPLNCYQECTVELKNPDFSKCKKGPCTCTHACTPASLWCVRNRGPRRPTDRPSGRSAKRAAPMATAIGSGLTQHDIYRQSDELTNATRETPSLASSLSKRFLVKRRRDSVDITGSGARREGGEWAELWRTENLVWSLYCGQNIHKDYPPNIMACNTDYCNQKELTRLYGGN